MRARIAWISNTRPDISCEVPMDSAVAERTFGKEKVDELDKLICYHRTARDIKLEYPHLYTTSL